MVFIFDFLDKNHIFALFYYFFMAQNYEIIDDDLGAITVKCSMRARRITFRCSRGVLSITVPPHLFLDKQYVARVVEHNRDTFRRLLARVDRRIPPEPAIYDGKCIKMVECDILIKADEQVGRRNLRVDFGEGLLLFRCHPLELASKDFHPAIARHIVRDIAQRFGASLVDMVREVAAKYDLQVRAVRIGRGQRILGHCSRQGVITISAYVLFMPLHLRRYIVCHELAHLSHFDHSASFHRLCNKYCEGNEASWRKEMRAFASPLSL